MEKTFSKEHSSAAKGLAILLLLTYHLFENETLVTSMDVIYSPFSLETFLTFTRFGNICVSIFVFLTSFGIATGLTDQDGLPPLSEAYKQAGRRFVTLMAHFAALYLSVNLLWGHLFDYQSLYGLNKQGILYFVTDGLGLSMFFNTPNLNETWWYMEIAYILIFLAPLLTYLVKKLGNITLLIICLLPFVVVLQPDVARYLFIAAFGVCAACGRWLDKLLDLKLHPALQWLIGIAGFVLCVLIRQNYVVYETYVWLVDAPIAMFLVYLGAALIGSVPILNKIMIFIGKHSMNIYLVHTFFYMILWRKYIYCFRYAGVTLLLLLACSLLYSVILELLKKVTRLNKLLARLHG